MVSTQPRIVDPVIVAPAMTMYTNLQYQVIHLHMPAMRADSVVAVFDGGDLVVTAEGVDCRYYRRLPLAYHARRDRIEIRHADGALEIQVPNPDPPLT